MDVLVLFSNDQEGKDVWGREYAQLIMSFVKKLWHILLQQHCTIQILSNGTAVFVSLSPKDAKAKYFLGKDDWESEPYEEG